MKIINKLVSQSYIGKTIVESKFKGDSRTIEIITKANESKKYIGSSFLGEKFDQFLATRPLAESLVYRRNYFNALVQQFKDSHIISVACGRALELDNKAIGNNYLTCLDIDPIALQAIKDRGLKNVKTKKLNIVTQSIHDLEKADLIYCVGLFDYLKPRLARRVYNKLFNQLKPNGLLVIGNATKQASNKLIMKYLLGWNLIYRDLKDLINFDYANYEGVYSDPCKGFNYAFFRKDKTYKFN